MSTRRKTATMLALPVVFTALAGAAINPTLTYHGYFDAYNAVGTCNSVNGNDFDGVWNVRVPDREGTVAWLNVQGRMDTDLFNGRPMFMFEAEPAVLTGHATTKTFSAYTTSALSGMPGDRTLTFTLNAHGEFTYTYVNYETTNNVRVPVCTIDFRGHQRS